MKGITDMDSQLSIPEYSVAYVCQMRALDLIHFASLEVGRQVKVYPYIHNYSLSYALFLADAEPLSLSGDTVKIPRYREDLVSLSNRGIYVSPARPVSSSIEAFIWGAKSEELFHREVQVTENYPPSMVQYEGITPGSEFIFYVFSTSKLKLPRLIRVGKKKALAAISSNEQHVKWIKVEKPQYSEILTPWDVPQSFKFLSATKVINLIPCKLIEGATWKGDKAMIVETENGRAIFPAMTYYAREGK
nr:type I-D CRISPR-associated protein Cas5/Csc1 [Candidatus Njordarchaeota archaeon]